MLLPGPIIPGKVNCVFTWGSWFPACDSTTTEQTRQASVTVEASGGGQQCPDPETRGCTDCAGLKSTTSNGVFVTADPFSLKMSGWSSSGFSAYCVAGYSGTPTIEACSTVGSKYTVGGCTKCDAGKFSTKNLISTVSNNCESCDIGTFSPPGATRCTSTCPAGFGNDVTNGLNVPLYVNVFFMLDASDSICDQWKDEIETAEDYCTFDMV